MVLSTGGGSISTCKCLVDMTEGRASAFSSDLEPVEVFDTLEEKLFGGISFAVKKGFA